MINIIIIFLLILNTILTCLYLSNFSKNTKKETFDIMNYKQTVYNDYNKFLKKNK